MIERRKIEDSRTDCGTSMRWCLLQRRQILFFIVSLHKAEYSVNKDPIFGKKAILTKVDLSHRLNSVPYLIKKSESVAGSRVLETNSHVYLKQPAECSFIIKLQTVLRDWCLSSLLNNMNH